MPKKKSNKNSTKATFLRHGMFRTRCFLLRKPSSAGATAGQSHEHSKPLEPRPWRSPSPQPAGCQCPAPSQHSLGGQSHPPLASGNHPFTPKGLINRTHTWRVWRFFALEPAPALPLSLPVAPNPYQGNARAPVSCTNFQTIS